MSLQVVTGRASAGKTGVAYGRIRTALAAGDRPTLVVPSMPDVALARDEFAKEPSLGLRILTFDQLVSTAWAECGDGRKIVDNATKQILLAGAIGDAGLDAGYRSVLSRLLDVLQEETGESWRAGGGGVPGTDLLARAVAFYAAALADLSLVGLPEAAHRAADHRIEPGGPVVFHRFDDFTHSQVALVRALGASADVTVTLTWECDFAPTRALNGLVAALHPDSCDVIAGEAHNTEQELRLLCDGLFGEADVLTPTGAVSFATAEGEDAQCRMIADEVRHAIEAGTPRERIGVAFRSLEPHYAALRRAFKAAGLDADLDVRLPVGKVGFGAAVLDVLKCSITGELGYLLSTLRSPYSGLALEEARAIEADLRRRSAESVAHGLTRRLGAPGGLLEALDGVWRGSGGWSAVASAVNAMFAAGHRAASGPEVDLVLDALAHRAVVTVLNSASCRPRVGVSDMLSVLSEATVDLGGREGRTGQVAVLPVTRLRGRRFDVLILGGLNAGEFPAPPNECMPAGSLLHETLLSYGARGVEDKGSEFERLLFYETLTRATSRVVLVGRVSDDNGEAVALSPFWEHVADRYAPGRDEPADIAGIRQRSLAEPPKVESGGREAVLALVGSGDRTLPSARAAMQRASGRPGMLNAPRDLAPAVLSASQIEDYVACPYRWFYRSAVRAQELEASFGARDEGNIAHELLRLTYEHLLEAGHRRLTPATLPVALDTLGAGAAGLALSRPPKTVAERVGLRMATRWVARLLEQDAEDESSFFPYRFEWAFGYQDAPVEFGDFSLRGRIDRLDIDGQGHVVVTDYKRSADARWNAEALLEKGKLQVLLYMESARRLLELEPVAGVYRGLKDDVTSGVVVEGSDAVTALSRKKAELPAETLARLIDRRGRTRQGVCRRDASRQDRADSAYSRQLHLLPGTSRLQGGAMKPRFTAEQKRAIETLEGSVAISAGAGSGKTTVLAHRFAHAISEGIESGPVPVDGVLTITFTSKAAGEVGERVRRVVGQSVSVEAGREVDSAWISTIHSLCTRLLRRHLVESGVSPAFRTADEATAKALSSEAYERAVFDVVGCDESAALLVDSFGAGALRSMVVTCHDQIRAMGLDPETTQVGVDSAGLDRRKAATVRVAQEYEDAIAQGSETPGALRARAYLAEWTASLNQCDTTTEEGAKAVCHLCGGYQLTAPGGTRQFSDQLRRQIEDTLRCYRALELKEVIAGLQTLIARYSSSYRELKRQKGVLDFDDLQERAVEMLERDPRIAERYRTQFKLVMVDEFQDTNELQMRVLRQLVDGNLCVVGDERQSIYGWRYADVSIFRRIVRRGRHAHTTKGQLPFTPAGALLR